MSVDVSQLDPIAMGDHHKFLVFDVDQQYDPKVLTGEELRIYLDIGLNNIIDNLNNSFVNTIGSETIGGNKTFSGSTVFTGLATFDQSIIANNLVDFSTSTEVRLPITATFDGTLLSDLFDHSGLVDILSNEDIFGIKTFKNGLIVEVGSGSISFPSESNVYFDGASLSSLIDKSNYLSLSGVQSLSGFKTFQNGIKIEKGTGSVEFPDKDDVLFNGVSLSTLMTDAGNFIDISDFVVVADLDDYVLSSYLESNYVQSGDIANFVNDSTLNTLLLDYVKIATNDNITGEKTFKNGVIIEKGSGTVSFPQTSDVSFGNSTLQSIFNDYTTTSTSRNIANCIAITGTALTLLKNVHHNKIIYFNIAQDCTVSLDPSETDWSDFQCKFVVHDSTNTNQVIFNFPINDGSVSNIIGHFNNINLGFCSPLSKWVAFSGNF